MVAQYMMPAPMPAQNSIDIQDRSENSFTASSPPRRRFPVFRSAMTASTTVETSTIHWYSKPISPAIQL